MSKEWLSLFDFEYGQHERGVGRQRPAVHRDTSGAAAADAKPLNSAAAICRVRPMLPPARSGVCVPVLPDRRSAGVQGVRPFAERPREVIQP